MSFSQLQKRRKNKIESEDVQLLTWLRIVLPSWGGILQMCLHPKLSRIIELSNYYNLQIDPPNPYITPQNFQFYQNKFYSWTAKYLKCSFNTINAENKIVDF